MQRQAILHKSAQKAEQLWATDRSLTALLVLLLLLLFVIRPLTGLGYDVGPLGSALFTLALFSGVLAVTHSAASRLAVGAVTLFAVCVHWLRYTTFGTLTPLPEALATLMACGLLAAIVFAQVFRPGPITMHRIQGAVAGYLLIAMVFTNIFVFIDLASPGAYGGDLAGPAAATARDQRASQLAYFSLTTLTTVGYGDITAVSPIARSMAMLEAVTGQLFPAILIARLVSMELYYRQRRFEREQAALDRDALAHEVARVLREQG